MNKDLYLLNKDKFDKLVELFQIENSKINLSSFNDTDSILQKHILDSLKIFDLKSFYEIKEKGLKLTIADIGTGGGFPGIPLAIALPHCKITLIESITKKCNAISNIINDLGLENITVVNKRAEDINEIFEITVSRAVAEFEKIYGWSSKLIKNGGKIYLYKSLKEEISSFNDKIVYNIGEDKRVIYEFIKK